MNKRKGVNFDLTAAPLNVLPHSDNLEREVLAHILNVQSRFSEGYKYLNPDGIFYTPLNSALWEATKAMVESAGSVTYSMLRGKLQGTGQKDLHAHAYQVYKAYNPRSNFIAACLLLNEYFFRRTIHKTSFYLNQHSLKQDADVLELLGEASDKIGVIYQHITGIKEKTLQDGIDELRETIREAQANPGGAPGLQSSIHGLNMVTGGYKKSAFIVVGASTHEGKTTLALQEARHMIEAGIPVGYISLEMKQSELLMVMACDALGLQMEDVIFGRLSQPKAEALELYLRMLNGRPLFVNDTAALKISEIKSFARNWVKRQGVRIVFIDHMHLAYDDVDHGSNSEQRFTNIANKLKELAKELDIPVVALAQLARKDTQTKGVHQITDLKYAGGIEQAADVILLIFRPSLHGITSDGTNLIPKEFARIIVGKLRLLPKRDVTCAFMGTRFVDWDIYERGMYQPPTPEKWISSRGYAQNRALPQKPFERPDPSKWIDE